FPAPAPRPEATLAYASATATPPVLNRSLRTNTASQQQPNATRSAASQGGNAPVRAQPSLSGRIPRDQIIDPMAGFASLPDKSEPTLLSGAGTTRHQKFALLSHPNQRQLKNVMMPGNRFVSASFEDTPYGALRTDRFDGPAIVVLPVRYAR
ncbi:MAG: ATP/GTP-binding protein, partial [Pseudomonadota bacterium]